MNLQKFGFPNADTAHLLVKTTASSEKEPRRQKIREKYNVPFVMW